MMKFEDICEVNPRLPKGSDETQNVSFLSMSSISEKGEILGQETRVLSETKKGFTYFERKDVLLAKITPCFENGKAVFTSGLENPIGFGSTEFHVLRSRHGISDGKYLFYLVWNENFRFLGQHAMKGAAGQKRVSADFIKNLKVPAPPLAEQKKIAAILDAADSLRQKDRQLIEHYTKLGQSLFLEMFGDPVTNPMGWDVNKLGAISKKITDGEHQNPPAADNGMNLVMAKDVLDDRVDFSKPRYVSTDDYNKYIKKCNPESGDILLVSRGATVGRCTIVNTKTPFCLMGSVILVKPDINVLGLYISYIFKHHNFSKKLINVSSASAQQAIYITHLKKLYIPIPPITLQNQFADRIKTIEAQKQQAQANLEKSEALFNSLLQRAFKGELTN